MLRRLIFIPILLNLAVSANIAAAQNEENNIEQLNAKILHLQEQIIEMQKKHDTEINALKQQMNELAAETGKRKAKDELTTLRELAKAKAAQPVPAQGGELSC